MICPQCNEPTKVIDTEKGDASVRRRRECKSCGHRFTTYEIHAIYLEALVKMFNEKVIDGLRAIGAKIANAAELFADLEKEMSRRLAHLGEKDDASDAEGHNHSQEMS